MKKLLLLLAAFTLLFISCEKEDENASLENTWKLTSASEDGESYTLDECELQSIIVFSGSNFTSTYYYAEEIYNTETYQYETTGECITYSNSGTYTTSGNTITLTSDGETNSDFFSISGNTLTVSGSGSDTYYDDDLQEEVTETWTWSYTYTKQ